MRNTSRGTRALVVAAALLLAGAPVADADPQDGGQQCPDQQAPSAPGQDQQCQGNPAEKVLDKVKDGADQAQRAMQQQEQQQKQQTMQKLMSQGLIYLVNGVPTCLHSGDTLTNVSVTPAIPIQTC
jgi:hypothetical protein